MTSFWCYCERCHEFSAVQIGRDTHIACADPQKTSTGFRVRHRWVCTKCTAHAQNLSDDWCSKLPKMCLCHTHSTDKQAADRAIDRMDRYTPEYVPLHARYSDRSCGFNLEAIPPTMHYEVARTMKDLLGEDDPNRAVLFEIPCTACNKTVQVTAVGHEMDISPNWIGLPCTNALVDNVWYEPVVYHCAACNRISQPFLDETIYPKLVAMGVRIRTAKFEGWHTGPTFTESFPSPAPGSSIKVVGLEALLFVRREIELE